MDVAEVVTGDVENVAASRVTTTTPAGKSWIKTSNCATKILWGQYEFLVNRKVTPENRKSDAQITKDVTRTMPNDEFIGSDQGREMLRRILFAYCMRNHTVGYCQGMNYICAHIMKNVSEEEDCFWLLAQIVEEYMVDQLVFKALVQEYLPDLGAHFEEIALSLLASREEELLALKDAGAIIPFINQIADEATDGAELVLEAREGRCNIPAARVSELRDKSRKQVQAEVQETKEWFAERGNDGNDPQTVRMMQQEIESKTHQVALLQEQLNAAKAQMEDLEEWRQVTEEESEVREAQIDLLKKEIALLMSEGENSEEDKQRLQNLEAKVSVIQTEPSSPKSRGRSLSGRTASPAVDVDCATRELGGVVRESATGGISAEELLTQVEDLTNKVRVVENELQRRNEAFDLQCGLLDATRDEKNAWQDATQVSNEFNVKLNMRIRDLEEQLKAKDGDSAKVKALTDDLQAKEDQIYVLTEMLGTFEAKQ